MAKEATSPEPADKGAQDYQTPAPKPKAPKAKKAPAKGEEMITCFKSCITKGVFISEDMVVPKSDVEESYLHNFLDSKGKAFPKVMSEEEEKGLKLRIEAVGRKNGIELDRRDSVADMRAKLDKHIATKNAPIIVK